jgi:hypothetical protein
VNSRERISEESKGEIELIMMPSAYLKARNSSLTEPYP